MMKVILFDFDGVIADTFSFCYRIIHSRDFVTEDEYRARFEGNINDTPKQARRDLSKPFDFIGPYTEALMACKPNHGLSEVIQELARTHDLLIISSTITEPIARFLHLYGLDTFFREILGNDVEKSKVKKIQNVLQRYEIGPEETVFITDTLGDIREARECDVQSIAVTWGFHDRNTLQKGDPYAIVSHPREILETIRLMEG